MKLIHCADLHLDAKMTANLDREKAKERREELLQRMVLYAAEHNVRAILIAGDMFDTREIRKTTQNAVLQELKTHPDIDFYYLKGNHDSDNFLEDVEQLPDNLKLFSEEWSCYELSDRIRLYGAELSADNGNRLYTSLLLNPEKINLVMLHGQESETASKDRTEMVDLRALRNKGIDYLALGHIHLHKEGRLDARCTYCYPGCLEGRGFDECGVHGFQLLEIEEEKGKIKDSFVPFASRNLYTIPVDVTGCMSSAEMEERARSVLQESACSAKDLVKILLAGEVDVECEKNIGYIQKSLEDLFYFVKVYDETKLHIDIEQYALDVSLRGEFVRTVRAQEDLSEEDRNTIIRYGLQILDGEKEVE